MRSALCLMDYRAYEIDELQRQKLEDERALARVQAELKQTKVGIVQMVSMKPNFSVLFIKVLILFYIRGNRSNF